MRIIGLFLLVVGLVGLAFYGYEAINASSSISFMGTKIAVTRGNWTPVIISGLIAFVGFFIIRKRN